MSEPLEVRALTVRYGHVIAADTVSFRVEAGGLAALVGPSGCGKTSVLRAIAGFETPAAGEVWIGNEMLSGSGRFLPPEKRRVGMLFQQGALFPHLTVIANVAFGLRQRDKAKAREALALVGLDTLAHRWPHELSGGQQQRVALARALAPRPRLILFDEPFAALDVQLRERLRDEVRAVLRATNMTAVLVTHDQEEALSVADQISVMKDGRILQTGTPRAIYEEPASEGVARLIGDANLIEARVIDGRIETPFGALRVDAGDGTCVVRIPPESLCIAGDGRGASGTVATSHFYGHDVVDEIAVGGGSIRVRLAATSGVAGARVHLALKPARFRVFLADGTAIIAHRQRASG